MKSTILKSIPSLIALSLLTISAIAQSDTPEEFISSYRKAIEQKDAAKLLSFYYTVGCTAADKAQLAAVQRFHFTNGKITEVSLQPLPDNFQSVNIMNGKKYETTYPPVGIIKVSYDKDANGLTTGGDGYAIIEGKYYLITTKSTDIGWAGPKDQTLTFMVMGKGMEKVKIQVKWNVSGVDQEKTFFIPSSNFMGQYFKDIIVTSTEDDTDVTLTILEGGKQIYESQPLKGKGILEYKRKT